MKRNSVVKFALSLVAFAGLLSSGVANAQSCSTYASNIVTKFSTFPPNSTMEATMATNNTSNSPYVSYGAPTPLTYVPGHREGATYIPPSLQSTERCNSFSVIGPGPLRCRPASSHPHIRLIPRRQITWGLPFG